MYKKQIFNRWISILVKTFQVIIMFLTYFCAVIKSVTILYSLGRIITSIAPGYIYIYISLVLALLYSCSIIFNIHYFRLLFSIISTWIMFLNIYLSLSISFVANERNQYVKRHVYQSFKNSKLWIFLLMSVWIARTYTEEGWFMIN